MRILLCLHAPPDENAAGVEVYTQALAHALVEQHEVALLYPGCMDASGARPGGIEHFVVSGDRAPRSFTETYRDLRVRRACETAFEAFEPEIVHVQHLMGLSSELPALAQERGIPVVMTLHDYWMQCAAGGQRFHRTLGRCDEINLERCASCTAHMSGPALRINALLGRFGLRVRAPVASHSPTGLSDTTSTPLLETATASAQQIAARWTRVRVPVQAGRVQSRWDALREMSDAVDRFIAPSEFIREEMIRFGLPPSTISRVALGVASHHMGHRRPLPDRVRHIAYLGGITRHKGVHTLIDAANRLPADVRTTIWGRDQDDPPYAAQLRTRATHPGIRFAGAIAQRDVPKHLREVDTLVVPSLWHENAALVIREAFAAGIPVVASRLGGNPEMLATGGGLLYDPDVPGELEGCLARLCHEEGLARRLVESQPHVRTMDEHALEISAIYREVADEVDRECE